MDKTAQTNPTNQIPDELVVRDADGKFKILRNGRLEEWNAGEEKTAGVAPHAAERAPRPAPRPQGSTPAARATRSITEQKSGMATPPVSSPLSAPLIKPVSRFYHNVDDEEEIAHLRQRGDEARTQRLQKLAEQKAEELIAASGAPADTEARSRLARAVVSRLKDVRDLLETKDVLMRGKDVGGVGMSPEAANVFLKRIEQARAAFEEEVKKGGFAVRPAPQTSIHESPFLEPETHAPGSQKPAPETETVAAEPVASRPSSPVKFSGMRVPPITRASAKPFVHPSYQQEVKNQKSKVKGIESSSQAPVSKPRPPAPDAKFRIPDSTTRPQMTEVRARPKTMGPVEELGFISLEDFRRMAPSVLAAADKIREKVELLGDESLVKRSQGVSAWKSSPLHQMYIALGRESMERSLAVKTVIGEWQKKNRPALSLEEFTAIADLNQKLAY